MEASKLKGPESGLSMNVKSCFSLVVKQLCPPYLKVQPGGQNLEGGGKETENPSSGPLGDNQRAPESRKEGEAEARILLLLLKARIILDSTSELPGGKSPLQISAK